MATASSSVPSVEPHDDVLALYHECPSFFLLLTEDERASVEHVRADMCEAPSGFDPLFLGVHEAPFAPAPPAIPAPIAPRTAPGPRSARSSRGRTHGATPVSAPARARRATRPADTPPTLAPIGLAVNHAAATSRRRRFDGGWRDERAAWDALAPLAAARAAAIQAAIDGAAG